MTASGRPSVTWSEAVDEALCWGWIDGIKRKVDEERYTNRFTPRKAVSKWSDVNLRRYAELQGEEVTADSRTHEFNRGEVWEENEFWIDLSWRIDPDGSTPQAETAKSSGLGGFGRGLGLGSAGTETGLTEAWAMFFCYCSLSFRHAMHYALCAVRK